MSASSSDLPALAYSASPEGGGHGAPGAPGGVARAGWVGDRVHLLHRVLHPIDRHVEPEAEEVLMVGAVEAGRNQRAVRGTLALRNGPVRDDAGQLYLELD